MYAITDLQKAVGYTVNQLRDRLDLLGPIFDEDLQRGKRGKILVGDRILAALRRMFELENQGLAPRIAQAEIIREVGSGDGKGQTTFGQGLRESKLIEILREELEHLRRENEWLRGRVDELTPLALPRPRRRLWPFARIRA